MLINFIFINLMKMVNSFKLLIFTQILHICFSLTTLMKGRMSKCIYKDLDVDDQLKFSYMVSSSDQNSVKVLLKGPSSYLLDTNSTPDINNLDKKIEEAGIFIVIIDNF